jgi:hypothetical protein
MKHFILMADIINSSEKPSDLLMAHFKQLVEKINDHHSYYLKSPLTITLGDEFQGIVTSMEKGIEIIFDLDLFTLTAGYRLRYVLVYGDIDTPVNKEIAYGMLGPGLTRARKELEMMKKGDSEILILGVKSELEEKLALAFQLYRSMYNDWPEKDREVAYDLIMEADYKKVAILHDRDTSSMWRKERTLKMKEFQSAKKLIRLLANE